MTAKQAWIVLLAAITVWEVTCPDGELLSEGVDRAIEAHPYLTRAALVVTALHLANWWPSVVDPFVWSITASKRVKRMLR